MGNTHTKRFKTAKEKGKVINKDGYHQCRNCYCSLTTRKGAYRDVTIELDNDIVHYYHQSPIVTEKPDNSMVLHTHGHKTKSTKQRINRYIPSGFKVYQENFNWFMKKPNGKVVEFKDDMVINQ